MHQPYEKRLSHPADFRVRYRFYSPEQGGRVHLPFQGLRCDFQYDDREHKKANKSFMIWPEFENDWGDLILEDNVRVPVEGTARMWIIDSSFRTFHRQHIYVGMMCHFFEARPTADCEVIELIGLATNPDS